MYTLYHYPHCPYCVRVRLTLGFLDIPYKSVVLNYDDEETPISMISAKMLPILEHAEKKFMPESMDIINFLDSKESLGAISPEIDDLLSKFGSAVHPMAMPYWMYTPEFNEKSRDYFRKKKEAYKGPFNQLVQNQTQYIESLNRVLKTFEDNLDLFYKSEKIQINDILVASHLWGMYIVPEFQFSPKVHDYLQRIKTECKFNYHQDFWES